MTRDEIQDYIKNISTVVKQQAKQYEKEYPTASQKLRAIRNSIDVAILLADSIDNSEVNDPKDTYNTPLDVNDLLDELTCLAHDYCIEMYIDRAEDNLG